MINFRRIIEKVPISSLSNKNNKDRKESRICLTLIGVCLIFANIKN